MKKISLVLLLLSLISSLHTIIAKDMDIYTIYDKEGNKVSYEKLIEQLIPYDIVLFGEMHNCPITHWLEKQIAKDLYAKHKESFILAAEMFESDNQLILDEYLNKFISGERFENETRLWPNYETDYMPLIELAKEHHIPFIATNVPRRYARRVKENGLPSLDTLPSESKTYIAPLPIKYKSNPEQNKFFQMMGATMGRHKKTNPEWMSQAQAIKDATMAWFIAKNAKNKKVLHFNGSYHSDQQGGIVPYLKEYNKKLKVVTISSTRQEKISALGEESINRADFIIVVREDMPTSY